ncbi:MAG: GNAT family N-acetyltransferase [Blastocatellia bacterium]
MNVTNHIEAAALRTPDKMALLFEDEAFTYSQLNVLCNRTANALAGLGIARGDRVALFVPNQPDFIFAYGGILKLGAVAVIINTALKAEETQFILNDSDARVLVTTAELYGSLAGTALPHLRQAILVEGMTTEKTLSLKTLLAQASPDYATVGMNADDPAVILYTSGATGFPKGAVISHGNIISSRQLCAQTLGYRAGDRLLLCLPLFHSFNQRVSLHPCFEVGATLILHRQFDAAAVARTIDKEKVTRFAGVPSLYARLYGQAEPAQLRSVQRFLSGTATLPSEVACQWQARYGVVIEQTFGSAETGVISHNDGVQEKPFSVGKALAGVELRIVNPDGGPVGAGEPGEILVRGASLMQGYWQRPEETAEAMRNGWFHTGDIGRMDADGYLYIVDRLKDMINVSGQKVYPSEVEGVLHRHPSVREAAVYGIRSASMVEQVCASVLLDAGQQVTSADLMDFCRASLADFKIPRFIAFVDQLPRSSTGKILKRVLRGQMQATLHEQAAGSGSCLLDEIQEYIVRSYAGGKAPAGFDPDYKLIDGGILDSLAQADLIAWVENRYGIEFALSDLTPGNFASVRALERIISHKRQGGSAGGQETASLPVVRRSEAAGANGHGVMAKPGIVYELELAVNGSVERQRIRDDKTVINGASLVAMRSKPLRANGYPVMPKPGFPRELEIVLNGPVGPQRMRDDTIVINGDGWYRMITPSTSWPGANEVFFSNLNAHDPDAGIDAIIAEYHELGLSLTWCVYPWTQPDDLGKRLLARGATKSAIQTFLGSTAHHIEAIPGVDVKRIDPESTEDYEAYLSLVSAGFRLPPDEEAFRRRRYRQLMAGPDPCLHLFLGRYNGAVAGCSAAVIKEDSAHMTGVFIHPVYQARGVFQSLRAASLRFLRELGIPVFTGHGNQKSAFWVERFGARPVFSYDIYQLDPPAQPDPRPFNL